PPRHLRNRLGRPCVRRAARRNRCRMDLPGGLPPGAQGGIHRRRSPFAAGRDPYALRHAAVSTWLNAGVAAPQVAEWAGHSVEVLLRVYAKCIAGQQDEAKRRILQATRLSATGTNL